MANDLENTAPSDEQGGSREALIQAAAQLFTRKGYKSVSTRELAERAGVNLGTISYHFGSKAQLFVETVHAIMHERDARNPHFIYNRLDDSREEAALELAFFICGFIEDICHPQGPDVCKLMFREVLGAADEQPEILETLISSVAETFYKSKDERLQELIALIKPGTSKTESCLIVHSIIGQCSFYVTNHAFVERMRKESYVLEPRFTQVREHVASFTLSALGLSEKEVKKVISKLNREKEKK